MDNCIRASGVLYARLFELGQRVYMQTRDQQPDYPRIEEFLDYWDKNIDGPIKEHLFMTMNKKNQSCE